MGLQEQQDILAKLYTDSSFRSGFLSGPRLFGVENQIDPSDINGLAAIVPEELQYFCNSLIAKRCREVEKMLPLVRMALSDDFSRIFRDFAGTFKPKNIKMHLEDALEFCRFLELDSRNAEIVHNAAKFERTKLEFYSSSKRMACCLLNCDIRELSRVSAGDSVLNLQRSRKIAVWIRVGQRIRHFIV